VSESPFRLVRQISSGPDGVSYEGIDLRDNAKVRVSRVFLALRRPDRWKRLCERVAVATHVGHPQVLVPRAWVPDPPDPYLVTDLHERALADVLGNVPIERGLKHLAELADVLVEAHRMGLSHGRLSAARVGLDGNGRLSLDLFDLRTGETASDEGPGRGADGTENDPHAVDVFALGSLAGELINGHGKGSDIDENAATRVAEAPSPSGPRVDALLRKMLDPDPQLRPSMKEVAEWLRRVTQNGDSGHTRVSQGVPSNDGVPPLDLVIPTEDAENHGEAQSGMQIGRWKLAELLGRGGMGQVFRAEDIAGGPAVALKVLHPRWSEDGEALRRFYREARVLAKLDNPNIARFIDCNHVDGHHYLAMELVSGVSLHRLLEETTRLPVEEALAVTRDVAMALADVHDLGVVHRDIKPANILLSEGGPDRHVKLCDFGIARETAPEQNEELTRVGLTVGTPHYMSPEQCVGAEVSAASDVYALGITLFKMLAGHVPFNAPEPQAIVYKHLAEPVPDIRAAVPELSEAGARLLRRMLAKTPEERIKDARQLLEELEPIRAGELTTIAAHPRVPSHAENIITYDFEWQLTASPAELWPYVSHTERLNRAIGLGAIQFSRRAGEHGAVETFGNIRLSGMTLDWREHPYEWVSPSRMGVLREFSAGPFVWLRSAVELIPKGSGTQLRHQIQVEPRGVIGRAAAAMEVGYKAKKNLERTYKRIDEYVEERRQSTSARRMAERGTLAGPQLRGAAALQHQDPFEEPVRLTKVAEERLAQIETRLVASAEPRVVEALCELIRHAPPQEVARIRPRALARARELDHREVLKACLYGAREGLFMLLWDVICPRCRIPSSIVETLAAVHEHSHCDACDLSFDLDFGRSVEIIFRAHPSLRDVELGTYCIGGPGHTPHVVVQSRLDPGERFEMDLMLEEGHYRVVGRQLPMTWGFTVRRGAPLRQWEMSVREGVAPVTQRIIDAGRQRIVLVNDYDREIVVRIEREGAREDAVTALEAATTAAFRDLFPQEVLSPGHLISIGQVSLLLAVANIWNDGDESVAFARLTELQRKVGEAAQREGGTLVKIHGEGVMAAFTNPGDAARAALALSDRGSGDLGVAVHTGSAMATSINDRLDYFGTIVRQLDELVRWTKRGQLALSESTFVDPEVGELLTRSAIPGTVVGHQTLVAQLLPS
jgi:serine/threonine protein kinase